MNDVIVFVKTNHTYYCYYCLVEFIEENKIFVYDSIHLKRSIRKRLTKKLYKNYYSEVYGELLYTRYRDKEYMMRAQLRYYNRFYYGK